MASFTRTAEHERAGVASENMEGEMVGASQRFRMRADGKSDSSGIRKKKKKSNGIDVHPSKFVKIFLLLYKKEKKIHGEKPV